MDGETRRRRRRASARELLSMESARLERDKYPADLEMPARQDSPARGFISLSLHIYIFLIVERGKKKGENGKKSRLAIDDREYYSRGQPDRFFFFFYAP